MKTPSMAYCTLATEILRHRKQADCSNNVSARLDRNIEPRIRDKNLSQDETSTSRSQFQQSSRRSSVPATRSDPSTAGERPYSDLNWLNRTRPAAFDGLELAVDSSSPHQKNSQPGVVDCKPATQQRRGSMWRPGLIALDQASVLATLQQRAERDVVPRSPPATPRAQSVVIANLDRRSYANTSRPSSRTPSRPPSRAPSRRASLLESSPILSYFQHPGTDPEFHDIASLDEKLESKVLVPCPESPSEFLSLESDITMVEEPDDYSPDSERAVEDMRTYVPDYRQEKPLRMAELPTTPAPRRSMHQPRALSEDVVLSKGRNSLTSVPIRARAKTGNGMLEFRANSAKDWTPLSPSDKARRKMSLNLPIKTSTAESEIKHSPAIITSRSESFPRKHSVTVKPLSDHSKEERELSYKHKHTFVGTASLDDFLELLDVSDSYTTNKEAVAKAFILLSAHEQLYARQCSTNQEGWDLVHKIKPEDKYIDYLAQLQVKLGSITLRQFLDLIQFDQQEQVNAVRAVEAFSVASHLDSKAGSEMGSKAKAFRSWLLTQKNAKSAFK